MILIAIFIMCKIFFEFFQMFRIVTNADPASAYNNDKATCS